MKKVIAKPFLTHLKSDLYFGKGHPFRERLRDKVLDSDIEARCINFDIGGFAKHIKHPNADKCTVFIVTEIRLWVTMKDHSEQENHRNEMQSMYIQGKLDEYIREQGFNVPCNESDEIERFLNFLSVEIPCVGDYFKVIEVPECHSKE